MSRTRAYRRAQRERVISRRLRHIREWSAEWYRPYRSEAQPERRQNEYWGHEVPGRWAKQDPYAHGRCRVCRWDHNEARRRMENRVAAEAMSAINLLTPSTTRSTFGPAGLEVPP